MTIHEKGRPMLDRLSPEWRYFLIGLLVAVLTAVTQILPNLDIPPSVGALASAGVSYLLLYFTPLTRKFGIGKATDFVDPVLEAAPAPEPVPAPAVKKAPVKKTTASTVKKATK